MRITLEKHDILPMAERKPEWTLRVTDFNIDRQSINRASLIIYEGEECTHVFKSRKHLITNRHA